MCTLSSRWSVSLFLLVASAFGSARIDAASFQGLGDVPGGSFFSNALAISDDGKTVVGRGTGGANTAFIWTAATGMKALYNTNASGFAYKTSGDGAIVVGFDASNNGARAYRYTVAGGGISPSFLGGLNPAGSPANQGRAWSISSDASVIVGSVASPASTSGEQAFRFDSTNGLVGLGFLGSVNNNGSSFYSEAHDVSGNGSVIVGFSSSSAGQSAFRYTQAGGMQDLGRFSGDTSLYRANAISTDGNVIVGATNGNTAFTWTQAGGLRALAGLGAPNPLDVNLDGSVIVGSDKAPTDLNTSAVFWLNGVEFNLKSFLLSQGNTTATGWDLRTATGISQDGFIITGTGIDPAGNTEAFIADIHAAVPEPSTVVLLMATALGGASCAAVRRRRRA